MRKLLALILVFLPTIAFAQTAVRQPDLRAGAIKITASSATGAATVNTDNAEGVVGFSITGLAASSAVLAPQASTDGGSTWGVVPLYDQNCKLVTAIVADGQYRISAAGRTNVRLAVQTPGIGTITVAYSASSISGLVDCVAPAAPQPPNFQAPRSGATEGNHVFKVGSGSLYGFSVTVGSAKGFVMIFDAASDPADGAVAPYRCYPVETDGTFGNGTGLWPPGAALPFQTGLVLAFSSTGCFTKTESASAFFSADFQ